MKTHDFIDLTLIHLYILDFTFLTVFREIFKREKRQKNKFYTIFGF